MAVGDLDAGFLPGLNNYAQVIREYAPGQILIGGFFSTANGAARTVALVDDTGANVPGFTPAVIAAASSVNIMDLRVQDDGKVLVAGVFDTVAGFASKNIARLNADGTRDGGFASPTFDQSLSGAQILADGRIIAYGAFSNTSGGPRNKVAILSAAGAVDTSFTVGAFGAPTLGMANVGALAVQPDGKYVIGGRFPSIGGVAANCLARLNADGSRDTGFAHTINSTASIWYVAAVAVQPDGKVLVGGAFDRIDGAATYPLVRLNADGSTDSSFTRFSAAYGYVNQILLQDDGKILIAGNIETLNGTTRKMVARLNADGTLDTSFPNLAINQEVAGAAFQADGLLLVCGQFNMVNLTAVQYAARFETGYVPGPPGVPTETVTEALDLGSAQASLPIIRTVQRLGAGAAIAGSAEAAAHAAAELAFQTHVDGIYRVLVEEGVTFGAQASFTYSMLERVIDRLLLTGQVRSYADAVGAVQTGLMFGTVLATANLESVVETLTLGELVQDAYLTTAAAIDAVLFGAVAQPSHVARVVVDEGLVFGAGASSVAELSALVRESMAFRLNLTLDDGEYIAWVMNTTTGGLSRYRNYPFNSFFSLGGRTYGVTSTGVYRLGGPTDDGQAIQARIRLGLTDFGTRVEKRLPEAFLGFAADGTLLLKIVTIDPRTSQKQAAHYRVAPKGGANLLPVQAKFGRGMKSVDWDVVIENVDGADFHLHSIEFRPLFLDRRTRS